MHFLVFPLFDLRTRPDELKGLNCLLWFLTCEPSTCKRFVTTSEMILFSERRPAVQIRQRETHQTSAFSFTSLMLSPSLCLSEPHSPVTWPQAHGHLHVPHVFIWMFVHYVCPLCLAISAIYIWVLAVYFYHLSLMASYLNSYPLLLTFFFFFSASY